MSKYKLSAAVTAALALSYASVSFATANVPVTTPSASDTTTGSDASADADAAKKAKKLEAVSVTGSLIPQSQVETATPVITITAQDIKARGFATVAQALQNASTSTGSVQGAQFSGGFTQGAQTLSMFGLPTGFVKYLIDGRPMGNFPALYNGSDVFNNLSSIPVEMVDHIDILPGGQSSLYGSDAIAGVINIVLKKKLDAPVLDVRYGWNSNGGGATRRVYLADSFNVGKLNVVAGVQFQNTNPTWAYSRDLTKEYPTEGATPQAAGRNYLVVSATAQSNGYYFEDPNNCANAAPGYGGTTKYSFRVNSGNYCGSIYEPGFVTLANAEKTANLYTHATFDVNENLQLYSDLLYNYQEQKWQGGLNNIWSTQITSVGSFYEPNIGDYVDLQHIFSPEEVGGYQNTMTKQIENSYMFTLGGKGTFGQSNWDYDLGFTHSDDQTNTRDFLSFAGPINTFFTNRVLGPNLGPDPNGFGVSTYAPNYAAFYTPITPADFHSFGGYVATYGKTWDNMLRGQVTDASLFTLPGGDAGLAVVLEGGNQGWAYEPDARYFNGGIYDITASQGSGHRYRYAATTEMNFPLLTQLTADVSGRYDSYKVAGNTVSHGTYNLGLEYRPFETLLVRAKYGTAFKVPTLADEFSGPSGSYSQVVDYYNCAKLGFTGNNLGNCPGNYQQANYFSQTQGNPALKPITAKVWNAGVVWAPLQQMSLSIDYLHFDISNEVATQSADKISQLNSLCLLGQMDINSPSCQANINQVTRDAFGTIQTINTPKVNVAREQVNALTANFSYTVEIGSYGKLFLQSAYSDELKHTYQQYAGDPVIDYLRSPYWNTDFKTKFNASLTWSKGDWSATAFVNRYGSSPNYQATVVNNYTDPGTGKLSPWMIYNASVQYTPIANLTLSFLVNNLFNSMPPKDGSYPGSLGGGPYNSTNYDVYGRQMYIEATYKFGTSH
ncbi:TonB-dependent receptor domain-containing protein [Dyella silvae]|uniref:TonB-dependent receptor domain-containing protein n=1 Tax=Dyella silvae TaxID=2994424 RepID=UPI0022644EFD|nr:TonB-dependent receptor [Dyella silvae]